MTNYYLPKPEKQNNWDIFDNVSFDPILRSPHSCIDTVESQCILNKDFNNCLKYCQDHPNCGAGYYIQFPDKSSFCVPLNTAKHPYTNPTLYVKNLKDIKGGDILKSKYFVNTKKFPYLDNRSNIIYASDVVSIKNIETNTLINSNDELQPITFSKKGDIKFQVFLPHINTTLGWLTNTINNNDPIILSLLGKNKLVIGNNNGQITYIPGLNWRMSTQDILTVQIVNTNKKIGQILSYQDKFYLKTPTHYLGLKNNTLSLFKESLNELKKKKIPILFSFVPGEIGYYCDNGNCKEIALKNTKTNDIYATYKKNPVFRSRRCYGACELKENFSLPKKKRYNLYAIILIGIIILLVIYLLWYNL